MPMQIQIEFTDDGQFRMNWPQGNKVVVLGLLELAKSAVLNHKEEPNKIVRPGPSLVGLPAGGN